MSRTERRFDVDVLREKAGDKVYARGLAYFKSGAVTLTALDAKRATARVEGSEDYRSVLTGFGKIFESDCTCPAIENWGFCKHLVATALKANEAFGAGASIENADDRIAAYLIKQDKKALVTMLVELAERDEALYRRLDTASALTALSGDALETMMRKAIDGATRTGRYVEYREATGWAEGVDSALDALEPLAHGKDAKAVARLALHAIDRIEQALDSIDDSDGYCMGLMERCSDLHLTATLAAKPDPVALASVLFKLESDDEYGQFSGACKTYEDALGDKGLTAYRALAENAWAGLSKAERETRYGKASKLMSILDGFAERDGDVDARIKLRMINLTAQYDYYKLAEFCLDQGRQAQAGQFAEEGLFLFEGERPDQRLLMLSVKLLKASGAAAKAEARLWAAFEKQPDLEIYAALRKAGGVVARDRAIAIVEAHVVKAGRQHWSSSADFLISLLQNEKLVDAAWAAARAHGGSMPTLVSLANASEKTHPAEALAIYVKQVEKLSDMASYVEAVKIIKRMARLRSAAEQKAYVDDLKIRMKRRRNLMKLLD